MSKLRHFCESHPTSLSHPLLLYEVGLLTETCVIYRREKREIQHVEIPGALVIEHDV